MQKIRRIEMIRIKFKKQCRDGKTGALYAPGNIVEFDDARAQEILSAGDGLYAERALTPADHEKEAEDLDPSPDISISEKKPAAKKKASKKTS
jgi:hypothetical protein